MFSRRTVQRARPDKENGSGANRPTETPTLIQHCVYSLSTLVILICPWLFFGLVKHHGGVQFSHRVSRWVNHNPKDNNFVFTTISSILAYIIGFLYGKSVTNLAQRQIAHKGTDVFRLSFFIGLKNRAFPWSIGLSCTRLSRLVTQHPFRVLALTSYMITFHFITVSSISSLITPGSFTRHASLQGKELDFGASGPECAIWFSENMINNTCDWAVYKGGEFTTCTVENQLTDVLESGRNNILSSQSNTSIGVAMTQLGIQFLGPMRGILPNGPNGIPQFDTIPDSPSFNASPGTDLTYNYTLELQGLTSNVSCAYTTDSPIKYGNLSSPFAWWTYNGTCDSGEDILDIPYYMVPPLLSGTNNGLGFWACGTGQLYTVYLKGVYGYNSSIGNIACTISPIQPAIFPVEYIGQTGFFATKDPTSFSPGTSSELVTRAIKSLGSAIQEAQGMVLNDFAESVLNLGIKLFGVQPHQQSNTSLRLFEAMIKGIIEYEATYIRLLYTASSTLPPPSCLRTIDGFVDYQVIGWFVNTHNAYFLIPLTIINIISLLMLIRKKRDFGFDPTSRNIFAFDTDRYVEIDHSKSKNWGKGIEHGPTVGGMNGLRLKEKGQEKE